MYLGNSFLNITNSNKFYYNLAGSIGGTFYSLSC